jgi:aryl-alcohol dehydrogenase-like predicted oxidoreductase
VPTDEARQKWLIDGLKKVEMLDFLTAGGKRTIGQAAIQFILSEPSVASVLPNVYDEKQLVEFAAASETPELAPDELAQIVALYAENFGLEERVAA